MNYDEAIEEVRGIILEKYKYMYTFAKEQAPNLKRTREDKPLSTNTICSLLSASKKRPISTPFLKSVHKVLGLEREIKISQEKKVTISVY